MTDMSTYGSIEPIPFVQDHFPGLILSTDAHELTGAVASAEYLDLSRPGTRAGHNLIAGAQNAFLDQEGLDVSYDEEHPLRQVSSLPGRVAINAIERLARPVFRYHADYSRAIALFSMTQYKIETGQPLDTEQITGEYERLMDVTHGLSRHIIKQVWMERYYKNLLAAKKPLNPAELSAARAIIDVCRRNTRNPLVRADYKVDEWRINRRAREVAA